MKEKKFDEKIERIYNTLSNEQKEEYKCKENRMNKSSIVIGIVFSIILAAMVIGFGIWLITEKEYALFAFTVVVTIIMGVGVCWFFILSGLRGLKSTDETKIKTRIERLEKQKQIKKEQEEKQLQKNVYYRLSVGNIKNVTILDSYTEMSDKLHAVLNYQEIIQTRVYKFKVDYNDGTSKVVTAPENSEEYTVLMPLVNKNTNTQITGSEKSNIEKLREYKQLLDDGIITQEEFDIKKKELL